MSRMLSQAEFAKLVLKIQQDKDKIQSRLQGGVKATTLATEYNIPPTTMRDALDACEIKHGHKLSRMKNDNKDETTILKWLNAEWRVVPIMEGASLKNIEVLTRKV